MTGNLRGSRLRKGVVTMQRADKSSSISNQRLAKQMSHTVSTAAKYYNIEDDAQSDVEVTMYFSSLFKPKMVEVPPSQVSPTFISDDDVATVTGKTPTPPAQHLLPPPVQQLPSLLKLKTIALAKATNVPLPTAPAPSSTISTVPKPVATPAERNMASPASTAPDQGWPRILTFQILPRSQSPKSVYP